MSFWNTTDGGNAAQNNTGEFDSGGDMELIPNNTGCIAAIEEAKWDDYEGDQYISLKWRIAKPEQYKNRVIFQKIHVFGNPTAKDINASANKAKFMLAAINRNAGGILPDNMEEPPTDQQLMGAFMGKLMAIKIKVYRMDKEKDGKTPLPEPKTGNWIGAVAPAKGGAQQQTSSQQQAQQMQQRRNAAVTQAASSADDFDDDIPFN